MIQCFSRPDRHISLCGHLRCAVAERAIPGAPEALRGLRLVFVSDTHVVRRTREADLSDFMARISALHPDLLLLGGDYADKRADAERFFEALAAVRAPLGCFGVVGNNDREAWPDVAPLRARMARAGCRLLLNERVRLSVRGADLTISGVDELKYGLPDLHRLVPPASEGRYRLLLSHFPMMPEPAPDLVLSGHTHGGQFNFFGITPYLIGFEHRKTALGMRRVAAGLHAEGGGLLLVSKGVGASRIPLRICVRPEIELLLLSRYC